MQWRFNRQCNAVDLYYGKQDLKTVFLVEFHNIETFSLKNTENADSWETKAAKGIHTK